MKKIVYFSLCVMLLTLFSCTKHYRIKVVSDDNIMGSVSGGGEFSSGETTEIFAMPNDGYLFSHWQDNDTVNPRSITVTKDAIYTAYFEEAIRYYNVNVLSENENYGTTTGSGEYADGTNIEIMAIPNEGYTFIHWQDGDTINPRTITVNEDATYIAYFEEGIHYYTITVLSDNDIQGNVSGGGIFVEGTRIELLATPASEDYVFSHWQDGNAENPRTITVTGDATYTSYFITDPSPKMIDLGLPSGTLWADRNVGASSTLDYGDYYAWGETETKSDYSWDTYMCNLSQCGSSNDPVSAAGLIDIAGTQFDVAHVKWGGNWKMPTIEQIEELLNNCSWVYEQQPNGQWIYTATGPNGNNITFPWAGYYEGSQLYLQESMGLFWSSSRIEMSSDPQYAYNLYLPYWSYEWNYEYRCVGASVRPISK